MSFVEKLIVFLNTSGEKPTVFGMYHIVSLVIIAAIIAALCVFAKNSSKKAVVNTVLFTAVAVIILEIYKQINYTFRMEDGVLITDYQWYAFPFQFCSTPMYVGLLAGIFRKGKLHDALCAYLATFALFAGLAVMIYPGDIYVETVGINFQTTICHGSMIIIAAFLYVTGHVKLEHKTILKAIPVFAVTAGIAMILNEVVYSSGIAQGETFNMFYFSTHYESTLPLYSLVHNAVEAPINIVIYVLGFSLVAYIMLLIAMGVDRLAKGKKEKAVA